MGDSFQPPPSDITIDIQKAAQRAAGGIDPSRIRQDYPAHQPNVDPLQGSTRDGTRIIYSDLPLFQSIIDWELDALRAALFAHNYGMFWLSGLLTDSIIGDPRVQATLGSLTSALFGREVLFTPANDSRAAREVCDAWQDAWPRIAATSTFTQLAWCEKMMGWAPAQIVWDTTRPTWEPSLRPWHPSFSYFHWEARKYVAISRDGPLAMMPGNGKWFVHFPFGEYRGWISGAVRAIAEPWLLRHQAFRDHGRYNEVHGLPIRMGLVPAASDELQRDAYAAQLANLGRETTIMAARGVDGQNGYGLELVEAKDDSWQSFTGLIDRCDMDIVLALMYQNLTTQVDGGAFSATKSHMDVRDQSVAYSNRGWAWSIFNQLTRPFSWLNYGDADLAPFTIWDVISRAEFAANALQFSQFGTAIQQLRLGGIEFKDPDQVAKFAATSFGIRNLPAFSFVEPPAAGGHAGAEPSGDSDKPATDAKSEAKPTEPREPKD